MTSKVITLRLKEKEMDFIEKLSKKEHSDKSHAARVLIGNGWMYSVLKDYKEGKSSIGKSAKELNLSITELIDLLADLGIKSPLTYENYLEGQKYAEELFK